MGAGRRRGQPDLGGEVIGSSGRRLVVEAVEDVAAKGVRILDMKPDHIILR